MRQTRRYRETAEALGLQMTGGSDFHGDRGRAGVRGSGRVGMPRDAFDALTARLAERARGPAGSAAVDAGVRRMSPTTRRSRCSGVVKNYRGLRPLRVAALDVAPGDRVAIEGLDRAAAEMFVNS